MLVLDDYTTSDNVKGFCAVADKWYMKIIMYHLLADEPEGTGYQSEDLRLAILGFEI